MKIGKKRKSLPGEGEYRFMQEKIKRKPPDWRKITGRILTALGLGVLFGAAACFTAEVLRPAFAELAKSDDGGDSLSLKVEQDGEEENGKTTDDGISGTETDAVMEIRRLEAGIYRIAEDAEPFLADVIGIMQEPDWFEEISETKNQSTGVVISMEEQVLILTSRDAVKGANYIRVRFCDGTIAQGREIGYDTPTNLSVIRVENLSEDTLGVIKEANFLGEEVIRGDLVIAAGRPLGQYSSVVYGHISGKSMKKYTDASYYRIYTDISASTEGQGVLLNSRGQVLGLINQSLASEGGENLITALGTRELQSVVEKLMNGENPGYFGIEGEAFSPDKEGIHYEGTGIYVTRVKKDFPAMAAGIQSGDILTAVNGESVTDMAEFREEILKYAVGDKVQVTLMRMGRGEYKEMAFEVELGGY